MTSARTCSSILLVVIAIASSCIAMASAQDPLSCNVETPLGPVNLANIPATTVEIPQVYKGQVSEYTWTVSPCAAVSQPPAGRPPCELPGFVSEYGQSACESSWSTFSENWSFDETTNSFRAAFTNSKAWTANVVISCGSESGLVPWGPVNVTDDLTFWLGFLSLEACPNNNTNPTLAPTVVPPPPQPTSCAVTTPTGTVLNLGSVPTATLNIDQMYQGKTSLYTWVVNLCNPVNQPPPGAKECPSSPEGAYISEYGGARCETNWPTLTSAWTYDDSKKAAVATFRDEATGWPATVYVGCGQQLELTAAGDVQVDNSLRFTFNFTTSAMCDTTAPPPPLPPTLPPTPTVGCSSSDTMNFAGVGSATLNIDQVYKGQRTAYTWVVNLCTPVNQPPTGRSNCANSGFISEYNDASCETSWSKQVSGWTYDTTKQAAVTTFTDPIKNWRATVYVSCGPPGSLAPTADVQVDENLHFTFFLASSAMCGATSPPPPLPPITGAPTLPPKPTIGCTSSSAINFATVPTTTVNIDQWYQGKSSPYTWVVNLCTPVNQPPTGRSNCANSGFISEYNDASCETSWNKQVTPGWTYDVNKQAAMSTFTDELKGWKAKVFVGCGQQLALTPAGYVQVSDQLEFTFLFTTSAMCNGSMPLLDKLTV